MAVLNPVPGMSAEELKTVYANRKALGLENGSLEDYLKKYGKRS